jgi:Ran GTPase-activating protein (RanGAP) involved in mRNA processing and transport
MQSLVHLLTYNTTIIDLNLSYNQLNPEGIKQLGVAFSQHNAIIRLNIGHNPLGSEGVVKLCQTLINNTTLRHLSLGHVGLGPTGAEALSYWLSTTAKLVSLQLPGNVLKSEGTKWLAASLAKNRHLKTLNLSMNQIDTQGAYQLSWLLSQTTTLSELDLSHNEIRDEAVYPLSMALRKNKGLTHFNLSHNPLVFSDINHLCASIGTHIHLQSVLLDNTHHSINEPYVTQYLSEIYHRNRKIAQADYLLTRLFSRISATNIHGAHARAFRIMEALQNHYFLKNTGVREKWIEHLIQFYQKYPGEILIDGLKQLLSSSIQTTWSRLKTLYALGTAYNHKGLSGNTAAFISAYVCFEQVANAHYEDGKTRLQVLKRKLKALYPDPRYLKYLIKQTMLTLHQKKWRTHKSPISNTLLFYFDTHSVFHHINLHQSMHLPILLNEVNEGPSVA